MPTGHYGTEVKGTLVHFGPLECDELIIEKGKYLADVFTKGGCLASFNEDDRQFGIATPFNDVLTVMVKTIQGNYDRQYLK